MNENTQLNGWGEYSRYVLKELERLNESYESLRNTMEDIKVEIATLKVKSGLWGFAGASVPLLCLLVIEYLKRIIH